MAKAKKSVASKKAAAKKKASKQRNSGAARYPRHALPKALRIPKAILDQNAGKPATEDAAAAFVGVGRGGPFSVEVSSAIKYGLLERPEAGKIQPSALAKQILRPQASGDEVAGMREAVLNAPDVADVYLHYRGENLPEDRFMQNTLVESFGIPADKFGEFKQIFLNSLNSAFLLEQHGDKIRVLDITSDAEGAGASAQVIKKLGKGVHVATGNSCFVMQPFAPPLGDYYEMIYKPAIEKAGLVAIRADADIFGTGKVMDQVFQGIQTARVLVAELTNRNPNVFYELGVAHALKKPVVLVSSSEKDVPFDLQHIRVLYYNMADPFWGAKLVDKVAESILFALQNPDEAIFKGLKSRGS